MTKNDRRTGAGSEQGGGTPRFSFTKGGIQSSLFLAALVLSVVTGILVFVVMRPYAEASGGPADAATSTVGSWGLHPLIAALIPVAIAAVPMALSDPAKQTAGWVAAVALTLFCIFSGFSIGAFYAPAALMLWAAMVVPFFLTKRRGSGRFSLGRVIGGTLVILPVIAVLFGVLAGSVWVGLGFWFAAVLVVVLGVLFALGTNYTSQILLMLGAAFMIFSAFDEGVVTVGIWWTAGIWLVVGLVGVLTEQGRP